MTSERFTIPAQPEAEGSQTQAEQMQEFQERTAPHVEAIFSDALCLTRGSQAAVELTTRTYARALRGYDKFRRRPVPEHLKAGSTRVWLCGHMHAVFCGEILAHARCRKSPHGD